MGGHATVSDVLVVDFSRERLRVRRHLVYSPGLVLRTSHDKNLQADVCKVVSRLLIRLTLMN